MHLLAGYCPPKSDFMACMSLNEVMNTDIQKQANCTRNACQEKSCACSYDVAVLPFLLILVGHQGLNNHQGLREGTS